jgi:hypothetical protein
VTDFETKVNEQKTMFSVGLRTFFNITALWKLTPDQEARLLGTTNLSSLEAMHEDVSESAIKNEMMFRISFVLGIYKQLNRVLPNPESADSWLMRPNTVALFDERSALDFLLANPDEHLPQLLGYLKSVV